MAGMTIKQYHRQRFYELLEAYRELKDVSTPEKKHQFVLVSLALYMTKPYVTQRMWREVNRTLKGAAA